jgi:hypothetical protein
MGRIIDRFYVDKPTAGKHAVTKREAGRRLFTAMKPGDAILVARLDSFSRSIIDFGRNLEDLRHRGVFLHVCDIPGGVFDPSNPLATALAEILTRFTEYQRRLISARTARALAEMRKRGERCSRWPRWGMQWAPRTDPMTGRKYEVEVANEEERAMMQRAIELQDEGYSLDEIRQYFSYQLKLVKKGRESNRPGTEKGTISRKDVWFMIQRGKELLAHEATGQ